MKSEVRPESVDDHLAFWTSLPEDDQPGCFVYVIQAEGDTPIKVGKAVDVPNRIAGLQTGNPRQLRLLHVLPGDGELEWQLHYRLRDCRLIGEWFDGEAVEDLLGLVADLAVFFVDGFLESNVVPSFWRFRDGWSLRHVKGSPATVTYTDPDPEWAARMEERRRIESQGKPEAPAPAKALFKWMQEAPSFTPHKAPR